MLLSDFSFDLPAELIAQEPSEVRDSARLLRIDRFNGLRQHYCVRDLPSLLESDDLVVFNDTRVFPARLRGNRMPSGGKVECLLLERLQGDLWQALVRPGRRLTLGTKMEFEDEEYRLNAKIIRTHSRGRRTIKITPGPGQDVDEAVDAIGSLPIPPYIKRPEQFGDRERYQTVYAKFRGSVAAPTAGLHFTPSLVERLKERGIEWRPITLHVGYGTFEPVRVEHVNAHRINEERFSIPEATAKALNQAIADGRRIVAVGTTTTRALETAVRRGRGLLQAGPGRTELYIYPGFSFQIVSGLLTNFHLPQSSLLLLVCAFGGRESILEAYLDAIRRRYRFYSYGDAMLIL